MALHAETSGLSMVAAELRATLDTLGVTQRRAARLFNVSPRHIRRWRSGDRRVPHAVGIVCNLLTMGAVTVEQAEAAAPVSARTNGSAKGELPVEPEPEQSALVRAEVSAFAGLSPAAAAVVALGLASCRFPLGDPRDRDFCFCGDPVVEPPYCERHRAMAYLAPRTGSGRGVHVGFVARGRHGRPSIPGALSASGTSRTPKILFDRAGNLPGGAPPPA